MLALHLDVGGMLLDSCDFVVLGRFGVGMLVSGAACVVFIFALGLGFLCE